jgi:hypothetical protein
LRQARRPLHVGNCPSRRCSTGCWRGAAAARSCCASRIRTPNDRHARIRAEHSRGPEVARSRLGRGPDAGGSAGPYRQPRRMDRYDAVLQDWLASGVAYRCFCTPSRWTLSEGGAGRGTRAEVQRPLPRSAERRVRAPGGGGRVGGRPVSRARRPGRDVRRHRRAGDVTFSSEVIGDPVIVRSDGRPAYNFAVGRRRRADGDHARHSRRRSHLEHATASADVRSTWRHTAGVRAPVAGARSRSRAVVQTSWRHERG